MQSFVHECIFDIFFKFKETTRTEIMSWIWTRSVYFNLTTGRRLWVYPCPPPLPLPPTISNQKHRWVHKLTLLHLEMSTQRWNQSEFRTKRAAWSHRKQHLAQDRLQFSHQSSNQSDQSGDESVHSPQSQSRRKKRSQLHKDLHIQWISPKIQETCSF